jgi:hypothetical protein
MPGRLMQGLVRHSMDPRWQGAPRPARSAEGLSVCSASRALHGGPRLPWVVVARGVPPWQRGPDNWRYLEEQAGIAEALARWSRRQRPVGLLDYFPAQN